MCLLYIVLCIVLYMYLVCVYCTDRVSVCVTVCVFTVCVFNLPCVFFTVCASECKEVSGSIGDRWRFRKEEAQ